MNPYSAIVIGSDGSQGARNAVSLGGTLAAQLGIPVSVVAAWRRSVEVPGGREQSWAETWVKAAEVELRLLGVTDVTTSTVKSSARGVNWPPSHALFFGFHVVQKHWGTEIVAFWGFQKPVLRNRIKFIRFFGKKLKFHRHRDYTLNYNRE